MSFLHTLPTTYGYRNSNNTPNPLMCSQTPLDIHIHLTDPEHENNDDDIIENFDRAMVNRMVMTQYTTQPSTMTTAPIILTQPIQRSIDEQDNPIIENFDGKVVGGSYVFANTTIPPTTLPPTTLPPTTLPPTTLPPTTTITIPPTTLPPTTTITIPPTTLPPTTLPPTTTPQPTTLQPAMTQPMTQAAYIATQSSGTTIPPTQWITPQMTQSISINTLPPTSLPQTMPILNVPKIDTIAAQPLQTMSIPSFFTSTSNASNAVSVQPLPTAQPTLPNPILPMSSRSATVAETTVPTTAATQAPYGDLEDIIENYENNTHQPMANIITRDQFLQNRSLDDISASYYKIVGGEIALQPYPWIVSLQRNGSHFCGGMLIHKNWVLTAGHCISAEPNPTCMIGGVNLAKTGDFVKRTIKNRYMHKETDVSLLELSEPVEDRQPVYLNGNPDLPAGLMATAIGWGRLAEGGQLTDSLMQVGLPIQTSSTCVGALSGIEKSKFKEQYDMCAGFPEGKKDACQGDSGGPLIVGGNLTYQFLIGVTSWGIGCARKNQYGIWVKTASIIEWLRTYIPDLKMYNAMDHVAPPDALSSDTTTPTTPMTAAPTQTTTLTPVGSVSKRMFDGNDSSSVSYLLCLVIVAMIMLLIWLSLS